MGKIVRMDQKPPEKMSGRVLAFPFNSYVKTKVSKIIGNKWAFFNGQFWCTKIFKICKYCTNYELSLPQ